jgi:hypothetical protein
MDFDFDEYSSLVVVVFAAAVGYDDNEVDRTRGDW